jgi:hypothetical protein
MECGCAEIVSNHFNPSFSHLAQPTVTVSDFGGYLNQDLSGSIFVWFCPFALSVKVIFPLGYACHTVTD